jgi:hypothetical protein
MRNYPRIGAVPLSETFNKYCACDKLSRCSIPIYNYKALCGYPAAGRAKRDLVLIVTRDQTNRDRADLQQSFNLAAPRGLLNYSKTLPQ